jgi:peptide/nickel transport system permease protein
MSGQVGVSYGKGVLRRLRKDRVAMISLSVLLTEIVLVLVLPLLLPLDPYTSHPGQFGAGPTAGYILGFDETGRDLLARLVYGGRTSLMVGLCSMLVSLVIGVPLGLLAGYFRGVWEMVVMRLADIFIAFPAMVLILVFVSVVGPSVFSLVMIFGFLGWTSFARMLYGTIISIREEEYIEAAKGIGANSRQILFRYVLPNSVAPILVQMTFACASAIIYEAGLSFLGVGVQPPMASWGNIIHSARSISVLAYKPWVWVPPGVLFIVTVLSINFIGDGLRRALNPKAKR